MSNDPHSDRQAKRLAAWQGSEILCEALHVARRGEARLAAATVAGAVNVFAETGMKPTLDDLVLMRDIIDACAMVAPDQHAIVLDPKRSVSTAMLAIIKIRCRQYLHLAIEDLRDGHLLRAQRHLGIAEGQVMVLYDTPTVAWRYLKATEAIRKALRRAWETVGERAFPDR